MEMDRTGMEWNGMNDLNERNGINDESGGIAETADRPPAPVRRSRCCSLTTPIEEAAAHLRVEGTGSARSNIAGPARASGPVFTPRPTSCSSAAWS